MIWFTSDLHFNHRAAIKMCERPFDDIDEMNQTLLANINACVGMDDTLYILGDVANKGTIADANALLSQIRCRNLILVEGNHDRKYDASLFRETHKLTEIHVGIGGENHSITLCHFPMMSWYKSRHGSLHLHGHIHSKGDEYNLQMKREGIYRYDVGVDANHYMPVSLKEILDYMEVEK